MDDLAIIIFGATGDLTHKKLVPALAHIYKENPKFHLIGFARRDLTEETFRDSLKDDSEVTDEFLSCVWYHRGDFYNLEAFQSLKSRFSTDNILLYLAVAPENYDEIIKNVKASGLNTANSRIIVEKPFGTDKDTALALYNQLKEVFADEQIYIIDHYLGKETLQNILAFRFGNSIFEEQFSREFVDSIQITVAEDMGILERGGYYDHTGAMRDMMQSHLLQILAAITMNAPVPFDPTHIHEERAKLISALKVFDSGHIEEMINHMAIGQYEGYDREDKVDPNSKTETYAALKAFIDNDRWRDVPVYLRTGKNLASKVTEAYVQFKKIGENPFGERHRNVLAFRLQPNERVSLRFSLKGSGREMNLKEVSMDFYYGRTFAVSENSYIRLLEDAIRCDRSLFTSIDEVTSSWAFIQPFVDFKETHPEILEIYPKGSWGPKKAEELITRDNRHWLSLYRYEGDSQIEFEQSNLTV